MLEISESYSGIPKNEYVQQLNKIYKPIIISTVFLYVVYSVLAIHFTPMDTVNNDE